MQSPRLLITMKMLEVCPPTEAVNWLRERRDAVSNPRNPLFLTDDDEAFEAVLFRRRDAYITYGIAKYGLVNSIARQIYRDGDEGIRCTILANIPSGGCSPYSDEFEVAIPDTPNQFAALLSNPLLKDDLFEKFFARTDIFEELTDDEFEHALYAVADNPRLSTPYDDEYMDGYAEYSYNRVFTAAWNLALTIPSTPRGAAALQRLLFKCLPPHGFDAATALKRWQGSHSELYLRTRIADLLPADQKLAASSDLALRFSYYRRFNPSQQNDWIDLLLRDGEEGLSEALRNENIWRSEQHRQTLSDACWNFPNPHDRLDLPNSFNSARKHMFTKHPEWFAT